MKIVHRYLLREYLVQILFCAAGFLVLMIGNLLLNSTICWWEKGPRFPWCCSWFTTGSP